MKLEPLVGKVDGCEEAGYTYQKVDLDDLHSAVNGLIKYHEDKIETAIEILRRGYDANSSDTAYWTSVIENGYEDIMAIELWLEDAI